MSLVCSRHERIHTKKGSHMKTQDADEVDDLATLEVLDEVKKNLIRLFHRISFFPLPGCTTSDNKLELGWSHWMQQTFSGEKEKNTENWWELELKISACFIFLLESIGSFYWDTFMNLQQSALLSLSLFADRVNVAHPTASFSQSFTFIYFLITRWCLSERITCAGLHNPHQK